MRIISEAEFAARIREQLDEMWRSLSAEEMPGWVTGPGRSGAIAAVYASHILAIPFVPCGSPGPADLGRVLIIDTARQSGRTLRKAAKRYEAADPLVIWCYDEPPRVAFWYEAAKPQQYRHERIERCPAK